MLQLQYFSVPDWPPLAWLAACEIGRNKVIVYHGAQVEIFPDWFCEAAWTGDFSAGDFDEVETVVGSGGRIRNGRLVLTSASSTVDRLHVLIRGTQTFFSNSLACILHAVDGGIRASYPSYNRDMSSIQRGLVQYKRTLASNRGDVELVYHDNLTWNGRAVERKPKPVDAPDFTQYAEYVEFLEQTLNRLSRNATAPERQQAGYRLLATTSTGYDSPTVTVLAARSGCRETICFDEAQFGLPDSGKKIAELLGLEVHEVSRNAWRQKRFPEVPIITGGTLSPILAGAEELLRNRILLTGYHGDKVWGLDNPYLGPELVRGDCSGLQLTEYRLWAGFLHCPVAFWGARKVRLINAVNKSAEMADFVIPGTDYNRPICRRVVEEAGIPRELFGVGKKFTDLPPWLESEFMTAESLDDYCEWLGKNRWVWYRQMRLPPWRNVAGDAWLNSLNSRAAGSVRRIANLAPKGRLGSMVRPQIQRLRTLHPKLINLRQYYYPWAVGRAKERYSTINASSLPNSSQV